MRCVGIEFSPGRLKLALCAGGKVLALAEAALPPDLPDGPEGHPVLAELLRNTAREAGIRCRRAALVLDSRDLSVRRVLAGDRKGAQLRKFLRKAFPGSVEEGADVRLEYAHLPGRSPDDPEDAVPLLGAAIPAETIKQYRTLLKQAGFRLVMAAPRAAIYGDLLQDDTGNRCILHREGNTLGLYFYRDGSYLWSCLVEECEDPSAEAVRVIVWFSWRSGLSSWMLSLSGEPEILPDFSRAFLASGAEEDLLSGEPEFLFSDLAGRPLAPLCAAAIAIAGGRLQPHISPDPRISSD